MPLTNPLAACRGRRHGDLLNPISTWFLALQLRKHLSCIPSTAIYYAFQLFSSPYAVLVPPTSFGDEDPGFIPTWHRGTSAVSVTLGIGDLRIHSQIGLLPYLPFIWELSKEDPDLGIIVIEVLSSLSTCSLWL